MAGDSAANPIAPATAQTVGDALGVDWTVVTPEDWRAGLAVELEHGSALGPRYAPHVNVTNDDLVATGKIALAHFVEDPHYYRRLAKMEAEAEAYWEGRQKPSPIRGAGEGAQKRWAWVLCLALVVVILIAILIVTTHDPRYTPAWTARYSR